ncbi:hypothetical protein ABIB57_003616 [Devosia sp. UYZn731]|uniref:hypothetical protein n=1 Tax=Devosia sp. UYZn731 TaxID=3156345 RepID=UPI003397E726
MMDWVWNFAFGIVPAWVWVIIAGLLLGWAWKTFGWQGIAGAGLAILTLGAYRQGWRDHGAGKPPAVPIEDYEEHLAPPPRRKRNPWSIQDILRGRNE